MKEELIKEITKRVSDEIGLGADYCHAVRDTLEIVVDVIRSCRQIPYESGFRDGVKSVTSHPGHKNPKSAENGRKGGRPKKKPVDPPPVKE